MPPTGDTFFLLESPLFFSKTIFKMERLLNPVLVTFAFAVLVMVAWAWRVVNWVWLRPKRMERRLREQGLCGNPYRLFYGDMKDNSKVLKEAHSKPIHLSDDILPRVVPFFHQTINRFGKKSFVWMGPTPALNIMDPRLIREILSDMKNFEKANANPLSRLLASGLPDYEGEKWAKHRKIINPAFYPEKLENMSPAFCLSCSEVIGQWEKMVISGEGSCELDVWPYLENLTADVISRTAFGSSFEEGRLIFHLQKELAKLTGQVLRSVYIPGWRFLPTRMNKRIKEIVKEVQSLLGVIINKKVRTMEAGEAAAADDLLGLLLESNFKEIQEFGGRKTAGLSMEEVIEECRIFYFAGQETTSVLLAWTMILLSVHPTWQERAREEVLQVFGVNGKPRLDRVNHLKVVTMVLHEVLRLYPPVTMLMRTTKKETQLGEMLLPPGVRLLLPIMLVQRDTEIWGNDAQRFKPERFSDGVAKATKSQVSFFPFSWGPRVCVGLNFAMVEAKFALTMILQRFAFKLSPSYTHAPFTVTTLQPQHGAHLILRKL